MKCIIIIYYRDEDGNTLFHIACKLNNWDAVTLLLNILFYEKPLLCGKLDILLKNKDGLYAKDLTTDAEISKLLNLVYSKYGLIGINQNGEENLDEIKSYLVNIYDDSVVNENMLFFIENTCVYQEQESDFFIEPKNLKSMYTVMGYPFIFTNTDINYVKENQDLIKSYMSKRISFKVTPAKTASPFKLTPAKVASTKDKSILFDTDNRIPQAAHLNPDRKHS